MMKLCPTCHRDLDEVERMGVRVDICPNCHGLWLDQGELEKVSEYIRATQPSSEDNHNGAPRFVKVYEASVRCGVNSADPTQKSPSSSLFDIFR